MIGAMTQGAIFIVSLVLMLGIVVVIHELGHYLAGRLFGAAAESFSVGFGRSIVERTDKRGTRWRINWIPLGGFVKFVGEAQGPGDVGRREQGPVGKAFTELGPGQRTVIALAGPAANFVLAILLFAILLFANGTPRQTLTITDVGEGGPAAQAGFMTGDRIVAVAGKSLENATDLLIPVQLGAGDPLNVTVERGGVETVLTVTPERQVRENAVGMQQPMGTIGIAFELAQLEPRRYGPLGALAGGVEETVDTVMLTGNMIVRMATGRESLSNLSGPVGIGDVSRRVVNQTMAVEEVPLSRKLMALVWTGLQICALISVGIGLFNLLPLPVLDGGHVVFNTYEAIMGKAVPEKIQEASLTVGLILLIGLFVVVTLGDVMETGVFSATGSQ